MKRLALSLAMIFLSLMLCNAQYDKDVFSFRGRLALSENRYADAISQFNILARLDSTDCWTFFYRGIAKYNLGDLRGAQSDFDNSVRLNPVFTNGYHYRAITLSRSGKYDEALENLETAISLRPGLDGLYYSRGVTYFLSQQFDKAVVDFDRYITKEPKDPSAYLNRGASYLFLNDTTKALEDYNRAIKLDRFDPEGFVRRGRLYAEMKDYPSAIADMDKAITLDTTNTFAYFNRAIMFYESNDYNSAMRDLDRVLVDEPGNALTLYNRSLIHAQVGNFEEALADMDHVININPDNVLAYFNRASFFCEMGRWLDALDDYDKAIELYPDFAKAYLNRSYVKNMLGRNKSSKQDYDIAQKKVKEYRDKNATDEGSFADTTKKYSSLLALDADFAKKGFENELLQNRDINIRLKPLFKFALSSSRDNMNYALRHRYENPLIDMFISDSPVSMAVTNSDTLRTPVFDKGIEASIYGDSFLSAGASNSITDADRMFIRGLYSVQSKQYAAALNQFDQAVDASSSGEYAEYYKAFYRLNRGVLRAEMIDFISSIENNVQTLTMDDKGNTRARVRDQVSRTYDYSEAIEDMVEADKLLPGIPYVQFNLGNLYCLSARFVESVESYTKAIALYPYLGDAFYNRGLVLIYLKDKEKGCIDLSRAGELGVADAYSVISKYCEEDKR
ncbi:MAG: tetratricopeptide repeat protein [Bacteroidales bacterium]|nr:tetratricopeptide repeat protein [Bacteroidales bacterium]